MLCLMKQQLNSNLLSKGFSFLNLSHSTLPRGSLPAQKLVETSNLHSGEQCALGPTWPTTAITIFVVLL
jgi:hypothetical protein